MFTPNAFNANSNGAYAYTGMAPQETKFNNVLTAEEIKSLQKTSNEFSLVMTEEQRKRAICNHRNIDGTGDSLVYDPITGTARCTICGYEFRPVEPDVTPETIKEDVARILDFLQTIKLMFVDIPADAAREYFQIIPLIEKIPQLFEFAAKNMNKHEAYNWQYKNQNMGTIALFNNLTSMFNSGFQQPMYQQPMYNNMPAGYPGAAQPNPFGYPGAQQPYNGYNPGMNGYAYNPGVNPATVQPSVVAPTAPTADAKTATVNQTVNA